MDLQLKIDFLSTCVISHLFTFYKHILAVLIKLDIFNIPKLQILLVTMKKLIDINTLCLIFGSIHRQKHKTNKYLF